MADASGLRALEGGFSKKKLCAVAEGVEEHLAPGENVRVLAPAWRRERWAKQSLLLVLTDRRLAAFDSSAILVDEVPHGGATYRYTPEKYGNVLEVTVNSASHLYRRVFPPREGLRILRLATGQYSTNDKRALLPEGFPPESDEPLLGVLHDDKLSLWKDGRSIHLYHDRVVAGGAGEHLPFGGGPVRATVDTAGNIAATRGRNLAAKGAATALTGPVGALLVGNARVQTIDTRMLWLLVEAPTWTFTRPYSPDRQGVVARFAQTINSVANQYLAEERAHAQLQQHSGAGDTEVRNLSPQGDATGRLRNLAALRDDGIVSEEEFDREKQRILGEI
jgi:hypothetical protein